MTDIVLQSVAESGPFDGDALGWILDLWTSAFGVGLFGLLLSGFLFVIFYVASDGDFAVATIALILSGTVTVSMVPKQYGDLALSIVVLGLAAALWGVVKQYVL
jgi:hypothetical protein